MPRVTTATQPSAAQRTPQQPLDASAQQRLAELIASAAGDGKRFPDLTSGECGVHGYELDAARGQLLLDLARDGVKLDPHNEVVIAMMQTSEEPSLRLLVVDKHTLHMSEAGEVNFFNSPAVEKASGKKLDAFHSLYLLLKDSPELPLAHGEESWSIKDFKATGPSTLPALAVEKPRPPTRENWVEAAGVKYIAGKMAQHAGGKFPALDAGRRGTHFYEVAGEAASKLASIAGGYYDEDTHVLVVALETNKESTLHGVVLHRGDLGKPKIKADWLDRVSLGELTVELLSGAREIPVPGRVEGFSVKEILDDTRRNAGRAIGVEENKIPVGAHGKKPFAGEGDGEGVTLGGVSARALPLHDESKKLDDAISSQRESGDGSSTWAFRFEPDDLKRALSTRESTKAVLFDIVMGKDLGALSEYDNFRFTDVGRKGAFAAMGKMLHAGGGDDKSARGTPARKALDKTIGAFLDRMLSDKDATTVFHVQSGKARFGSNEAVVAVNRKTGEVNALVNSWAP